VRSQSHDPSDEGRRNLLHIEGAALRKDADRLQGQHRSEALLAFATIASRPLHGANLNILQSRLPGTDDLRLFQSRQLDAFMPKAQIPATIVLIKRRVRAVRLQIRNIRAGSERDCRKSIGKRMSNRAESRRGEHVGPEIAVRIKRASYIR